MKVNIKEIINFLDRRKLQYVYKGDKELNIEDFCSLKSVKSNSITWIKNSKDFDIKNLDKALQLLIITDNQLDIRVSEGYNVILCQNPKEVFFNILSYFFNNNEEEIVSLNSTVLTTNIGKNVKIGCNCFIGKDVIIRDNVIIKNNVTIEGKTLIGRNSLIHSGVVIGTDGFGYYKDENGEIGKIPHFGGVVIGENVEIGVNTCIDRGTIDDTIIEDNVKIDNLCHIAHNVHIKKNSMVIALSMLGGSCTLEDNSYIAPGALIMNQISIGENSLVGLGAVVTKSVEAGKVVAGVPAKVLRNN